MPMACLALNRGTRGKDEGRQLPAPLEREGPGHLRRHKDKRLPHDDFPRHVYLLDEP